MVYDEEFHCTHLRFQPEAELFLESFDQCWSREITL